MENKANHTDETAPSAGWQAPLVDMVLAVLRRRWMLAAIVIIAVGAGVIQYLRTPTTYRSSSVVLLMSREKPVFDVSVDAGSLETAEDGARREATGTLMLPANPDLYITLLKSRPVLQSIVSRYEEELAASVSGKVRSEELISKLRSMIVIEASEEGIMTITVTSTAPQLSADLANALVQAVEQASKDIEAQLLNQQLSYIEQALRQATATLDSDLDRLKAFAETHRVVDPGTQASDRLRQIRETSQRRDDLQLQLEARRVSWTDADPVIQELIRSIELCDQRIEELQGSIVGEAGVDEFGSLVVDHQALIDQVQQQQDLVASLSAQADVLRIRADQPAGSIAIIRSADPNDRPAGPSRKRFLGISLGLGLFIGLGLVLILEQWMQASKDPYVADRAQQIRSLIPGLLQARSTPGIEGAYRLMPWVHRKGAKAEQSHPDVARKGR